MFRRHFFLVGAVIVLALMIVVGVVRLMIPGNPGPGGGPPGAQAKGPGGGPPGRGGRGGGMGGPGMGGAAVTPGVAFVRPFTDRIEVLGVAKGRESVTLTSSTTELVTRVRFRDGQTVQRGAVLVDLQAGEEDANITVARAAVNQTQRQYDRWKQLFDRGYAPRASLDLYQAQYEQAVANLRAAQSRRADRAIRAPFTGVVGISDIAPGALINPGAVIATLDDVSVIRVDFDIPDRYLSLISQGQPIVARPDALPGESFAGRIAMLNTRIDERTRSIRGRAEFANPGRRLKPGMLIRVGIDRGQRQAIAVPEAAVQYENEAASVFMIVREGGKTVAKLQPVTVGASDNGFVEIRAGLKAGDRVVADGLNRVQPGQPVRLAGPGGQPAAGAARPAR